jgi:hypothetical protein
MFRKMFGLIVLVAAATFFFSLSSCGFNQHLVSINIPEKGGTFGAADSSAFFDFTAFGTYIHPPQTKDITDLVTWQSDNPNVVVVSSMGVVSPSLGCGLGNIFATFKDGNNEVVSNSVPITVDGPASQGCPQGTNTNNLSVAVTGGANGLIVSSPSGINCGTTCAAPFPSGTMVALTPTPITGHSFGGWGIGCDSISGTTCTVTMNSDRTVSATFN